MRILFCILAAALSLFGTAGAQPPADIDALLAEVEANNLELKALGAETEARGAENLSGSALADPEIEFAYLFGPAEVGRRRDISVSQRFDFAALSGTRRNAVLQENDLLALQLRAARREILTEARKLICEIIARNALVAEYTLRVDRAARLEDAYRKGMESGEFSLLDYRKAAVNLAEAEGGLELLEAERRTLLAELAVLNGGRELAVTGRIQGLQPLPDSFDDWLGEAGGRSSVLAYVRAETRLQEARLKLSRSERLPGLSVGYMAELLPGEDFRGVKVGISIPLWSASRKVAGARRQVEAARISEDRAVAQFRIQARSLYENARHLRDAADKYDALARLNDSRGELEKALSAGSISLLDYIGELSFFYKTLELAIDTEKQYGLAVADLLALEM